MLRNESEYWTLNPPLLALSVVSAVREKLDGMVVPIDDNRTGDVEATLITSALASAAVDQILVNGLGLAVAATAEVLLPVFARILAPDPAIVKRVESKQDVLIEEPFRTGLDQFRVSLEEILDSHSSDRFLDERLHDAQTNFDSAASLLEARKLRRLISEWEGKHFSDCLGVLRALCAAARGDHKLADIRGKGPLACLRTIGAAWKNAEAKYELEAMTQERVLADLRAEIELHDNYEPSELVLDQLDRERWLREPPPNKIDPTYDMSPRAEYDWHQRRPAELPGEIARAEEMKRIEVEHAQHCKKQADRCKQVITLLEAILHSGPWRSCGQIKAPE